MKNSKNEQLNIHTSLSLDEASKEFINTIKNTSMSKSYKIPLLWTFYNSGNIKLKINEDEVYNSFKEFYSKEENGIDLEKSQNTKDYKSWGKKEYVKLAKNAPIKYLSEGTAKYFYKENDLFCISEKLNKYINNDEFKEAFKDAIEELECKYYKREVKNKVKGDIQFMELKNLVEKFDKTYESTYKTDDEELRLEFIKQFPIESLENLKLERYALGKQPNNMCWWLEFHTVPLGSIKGGNAKKFKIYYSSKDGKWIYPNHFSNVEEAWIELRKSIFNFINNFRVGKYELLDDNSMISSMNMFKTKLLYMYFPEKLLPVYSLDHIKKLLKYFGYKDDAIRDLNIVKANMELKKIQSNIDEFKNWDGLKFMRFIYSEIFPLLSDVSEEPEDNLSTYDYENSLEVINKVKSYIQNEGYNYTHEQLSNLYLSLKTKPLVILAGISGTGKSKIVRLMSQALGAKFNQISIRPDYNDSTELIGYKNLNDEFIQGTLTKVIEEASKEENKNKPYFVCLDEMNLARVEYYLSDYLSIIESRKKIDDEIITDNIVDEDKIKLHIPDNLYIIGTVNMDDTTFQFSRKVLDRANTIEFSDVDLENLFPEETQEQQEPLQVDNNFLKTNYLKTIDIEQEYREYAKTINKKIIEINEILKISQKQFAYRVRDEIIFYMIENKKSQLLNEEVAFDYQIMQKILPAIVGSEYSVCEVLINLFNYVCGKKVIDEIDIEEAENYIQNENVKYENSAKKILYMLKGYQNDGYCSYWY